MYCKYLLSLIQVGIVRTVHIGVSVQYHPWQGNTPSAFTLLHPMPTDAQLNDQTAFD